MYAKNYNNLEHKEQKHSYFHLAHFNLQTWMTTSGGNIGDKYWYVSIFLNIDT